MRRVLPRPYLYLFCSPFTVFSTLSYTLPE